MNPLVLHVAVHVSVLPLACLKYPSLHVQHSTSVLPDVLPSFLVLPSGQSSKSSHVGPATTTVAVGVGVGVAVAVGVAVGVGVGVGGVGVAVAVGAG